ncbi:hypothetical protein GEV33_006036 [Tenebrio molitor]|uniref:Uncharacterized protein n=1 Tax=Tenebrio molitor TaxID=7067 RepID=A0A8J6LDI7_TENMO|nr:hypothetical protein GEV33_006036 [Tenebrio molitor]
MKNRVKTKANTFKREARKTGGGENEAIPLTATEEKMLSLIGIESIEGISGGIDSFLMNNPASSESPDLQLPVPQPLEIISIPGPSSSNPDTFRDAVMNTSVELLHVASEFNLAGPPPPPPPETISISEQPSASRYVLRSCRSIVFSFFCLLLDGEPTRSRKRKTTSGCWFRRHVDETRVIGSCQRSPRRSEHHTRNGTEAAPRVQPLQGRL